MTYTLFLCWQCLEKCVRRMYFVRGIKKILI